MKEKDKTPPTVEERRDFLRKSTYAAYATPVIAALLVDKASAAASTCSCTQSSDLWNSPPSSDLWQQNVGSSAWSSAWPL